MINNDESVIQVFARVPQEGKVKTRLIPVLGTVVSTQLYRNLLTGLLERLKHLPEGLQVELWMDSSEALVEEQMQWGEYAFPVFIQEGESLGERMLFSIRSGLQRYKQVILVGSDLPELGVQECVEAVRLLSNWHDLVLGPTFDGGYGLIGVNSCHKELFTNINWSTEKVLSQTLIKAEQLRLSVALLSCLYDIDQAEDLKRFQYLLPII
jgi:rSAM/selenodomain-associated transferase 1